MLFLNRSRLKNGLEVVMSNGDRKLLTFEFISLNLVSFFAFCNMAVFYSFFNYLARIGIPVEWRGFLVGLEPMAAFLLRLAVIPLLHVGNAAGMMCISLAMVVVALCSYGWVVTIPGLALLRIFHGAAFVLLVSASMSLVVHFIPKEKSGQGFGLVSISVLIPYAVMPLVTEALLRYVGNEALIYRGVTLLAAPAFFLLFALRRRLNRILGDRAGTLTRRPTAKEIRQNLKESRVTLILMVNFLLYLSYASVFFFIKGYSLENGITDVGSFFTLSTLVMIALRLSGGGLFDRIDKLAALRTFMFLLIPCFVLFGHMQSNRMLYLMAGYYGVCIGFILPLLNASLFVVSPPHLRGLNTNLSLFMMDGAFFLSPYAGGAFIAAGYSFGALFNICSCLLVLNLIFLVVMGRLKEGTHVEAVAETGSPSGQGGAFEG